MMPSLNIIRIASNTKADVIFLDAQPSLGLLFFTSSTDDNKIIGSIAHLQITFAQSFVVIHGQLSSEKLSNVQLGLSTGTVRLFSSPNIDIGIFHSGWN